MKIKSRNWTENAFKSLVKSMLHYDWIVKEREREWENSMNNIADFHVMPFVYVYYDNSNKKKKNNMYKYFHVAI